LQANQIALQTTGNNIANVNTEGYSRQKAVIQTETGILGQGGYIGRGVSVQTIQRTYSEFLTRQATMATSVQSGDVARANSLKQLQGIFEGGKNGLGAAISDMLNAFSDVVTAPTDQTARTVALSRIDETASRMRAAARTMQDIQQGTAQSLSQKTDTINSLAQSVADVNLAISRATSNGQPPNDLLDRRDQLIRTLNTFVQTSNIAADDGTVSVFIGGSQALVLGVNAAKVSIVEDDFGDALKNKLAISRNGVSVTLDENSLGGGEVAGLLRFQNTDLNEGRNLLGRLTLAISTAMNDQHKLGLDIDGNVGGNLFSANTFTALNVLKPVAQTTPTSTPTLAVADPTKLVASDYEMSYTATNTVTITRLSDGEVTSGLTFNGTTSFTLDGLTFSTTSIGVTGDRFLFKPFSTVANNIKSEFLNPRALAVASPVAGQMGANNMGSLQQVSLQALINPTTNLNLPAGGGAISLTGPVTLTFTSATQYTRSDLAGTFNYIPGQSITGATTPPEWSLQLTGTPKVNDTFVVKAMPAGYVATNSANATALTKLRDKAMFDGVALTDGFAGLISTIGIRTQSANYAAEVSSSIATNLDKDRAGVSGVNLDEEAAKLLQFQQSYQASAKMIQVAQSIFDALMQSVSR
jgi:flagellar hook-associated protein 1 FlgK